MRSKSGVLGAHELQQLAQVARIRSPQARQIPLPRVAGAHEVVIVAPGERFRSTLPQQAVSHEARMSTVSIRERVDQNELVMEACRDFVDGKGGRDYSA